MIDTPGNRNTVTWEKGIDDKKPSISNLGTKNKIKKAASDEEAEEAEEEEEEEAESKSSDDMGISKTVDNALSKLDVLGKGNKGSVAKSSGDMKVIEITGNREVKTLKLKGEKLIITGNFNKLKVKGTCSELLVRGNANVVEIAAVGIIRALGNLNKVYWESGLDDENPSISNVGTNNEISQVED